MLREDAVNPLDFRLPPVFDHTQADIFLQSIIDSMSSQIAILDEEGTILLVNRLWQRFADQNGLAWDDYGVGRNYIAICEQAEGENAEEAPSVAQGIRDVAEGRRKEFYMEYPCHGPEEHRWFTLRVSRLVLPQAALRLVVVHENVTSVRQNENDLREVQRQLAHGRESERLRLAQELHDVPIQDLVSAQIHLAQVARHLDQRQANQDLETARHSVTQTIQMLRTLCYNLRPPILEDFGLAAAIEAYVEQVARRTPDLDVQLNLPDEGRILPSWMEMALLRIVQQSLDNTVQHAQATQAEIELTILPRQIVLRIADNGRGFEVPPRLVSFAREGHLGIVGCMERAEEIGGEYIIRSAPGQGTRIQVRIPLEKG